MITVDKAGINIDVLLNTGLHSIKSAVTIKETDTGYEVYSLNSTEEIDTLISEAVEAHVELGGDYTSVMGTYVDNMRADMSKAIENLIDSKAREYRYDDMKSVRSYTGFENGFRAECITLATWGASCWAVAGQIEADVAAGNRAMPTIAQLLAEMPTV